MIYLKDNPKGIDHELQRIQKKLYAKLIETWAIPEEKYDCYGRCYRTQDEQGLYIPEFYTGQSGKEYTDTLMNDYVFVTSFFGIANEIKPLGGGLFTGECHLIYCLDISKLYPDITHRADEEIHSAVMDSLRAALPFDSMTKIVTGMDYVFMGYNGLKSQQKMRFEDMHPKHCFRINFELTFENKNC